MKLKLNAELTPKAFAEIGHPSDGFISADGKYSALYSTFPSLYWPGRSTYEGHRLKHRVSLYQQDTKQPLAVFDLARYPINDLAFHPTEPLIALATGAYDGGYLFEGELLVWNWKTGESFSLLAESREVLASRFLDNHQLAILLHPPDEDDFVSDAFNTYYGLVLNDWRSPQTSHRQETVY